MDNKERIKRSFLAKDFMESELWTEYLEVWFNNEKKRLSSDYISLPNTEKFHSKREDLKSRYGACGILEGLLKTWIREKKSIEKQEELRKADKAIKGAK